MSAGESKSRKDAEPAGESPAASADGAAESAKTSLGTAGEPLVPVAREAAVPAVDSTAVELPRAVEQPPAAPVMPLTIHQPAVRNAPSPAANPIVDVSAAPSTTPSFYGHAAEPPMNPLGDIAGERPELLVGAAFAGGILAAMILRRLGN